MLRIKKVCYLVQQNTQHCVSIDSVIHGVAVNTHMGVGIAQWLQHWTCDWKDAGLNPCWSGGKVFFSRVNFMCWLLFRYPFHPCVTTVAHKRPWSFCQKRRWQVTAKHTYTLRMWVCMKWHGAWLYGVHRTCRDGSSFLWHQPCQCCKYTTSVDIQKMCYKKLFTHVESRVSAVSLLKSRELHYIKAINNNNTENLEQIFNNVLTLWLAQQTNHFMWHSSLWWYIPIPVWLGKAEQYWRYQDE